jgi:septal ring factor EnvC (AmiA/AmiB activator)
MPKNYDERFDRLEALIERGFAAVAQDIADCKREITERKAQVASLQSDMTSVKSDIQHIRAELRDIRECLDALEAGVQSMSGFAKEIDHLLQRVSAIEKHLGIRQDIAA